MTLARGQGSAGQIQSRAAEQNGAALALVRATALIMSHAHVGRRLLGLRPTYAFGSHPAVMRFPPLSGSW